MPFAIPGSLEVKERTILTMGFWYGTLKAEVYQSVAVKALQI